MQFLRLTADQAATTQALSTALAALEPRQIAAGDGAGDYVLPMSVLADPTWAAHADFLGGLPTIDLDPATAWPHSGS